MFSEIFFHQVPEIFSALVNDYSTGLSPLVRRQLDNEWHTSIIYQTIPVFSTDMAQACLELAKLSDATKRIKAARRLHHWYIFIHVMA